VEFYQEKDRDRNNLSKRAETSSEIARKKDGNSRRKRGEKRVEKRVYLSKKRTFLLYRGEEVENRGLQPFRRNKGDLYLDVHVQKKTRISQIEGESKLYYHKKGKKEKQ